LHRLPNVFVKAYLDEMLTYGQVVQLLERLAASRGWQQSVLYYTALVMMEQARMAKEE